MKVTHCKIAIVTLHGYFNYGNKLQNYALESILKKLGFQVDTIVITDTRPRYKKLIQKIKKEKLLLIKYLFKQVFRKKSEVKSNNNQPLDDERTRIFKSFSKNYLSEKFYDIVNIKLSDVNDNYDFFITGSDQVWNPLYFNSLDYYFLTFVDKKKRIAYAPSFGVSNIPENYRRYYSKLINGMSNISVREEAGAEIIKKLTGRNSEVLVDPTLLLDKDDWVKILKKASNKPNAEYLLTYFLGGIPNEHKEMIQKLAKKNKLSIINLGDISEKDSYITGPSEFLDYINDCSIFCTDSFHGVVFSILLEKPFIVFKRVGGESMYSRIETLLNKFQLSHRKVENIKDKEDIFNIDYSHVQPILADEKAEAFKYLKDALALKDEK